MTPKLCSAKLFVKDDELRCEHFEHEGGPHYGWIQDDDLEIINVQWWVGS